MKMLALELNIEIVQFLCLVLYLENKFEDLEVLYVA